jgi:GGDEF domain-containing protein
MSGTADHLERFLERLSLLSDSRPLASADHIEPPSSRLYLPITDPLTRLPHRRAILALAEQELHRQQSPLSLALFDVDDFKAVNERYGILGADAVLTQLGELLARTMHSEFDGPPAGNPRLSEPERRGCYGVKDHRHEFVGRFGGDRFLVVASNTTHNQAVSLVDRLADSIRAATFTHRDDRIKITASFGIAVAEPSEASVHAERLAVEEGGVPDALQPFIRLATDNMDEAKRKRRDRRSKLQ